jgi:hypothetical protein
MALSVSHPVSTRDTNMTLITWLKVHSTVQDFLMFKYMINIIWYVSFRITSRINPRPCYGDIGRGLIRDVIRKEPYHIMFIIYLNMRKYCSVLWTFSHVINIILRGMIKGWWYRYQSRQTNTVVMFFQYYICKFPLLSTKYMIKRYNNFNVYNNIPMM